MSQIDPLQQFVLGLQSRLERGFFDQTTRDQNRLCRENARNKQGVVGIVTPPLPPVGDGVHERAVGVFAQRHRGHGDIVMNRLLHQRLEIHVRGEPVGEGDEMFFDRLLVFEHPQPLLHALVQIRAAAMGQLREPPGNLLAFTGFAHGHRPLPIGVKR